MQNVFQKRRKRNKFTYKSGDKFGRLTYTGHTFTKSIYGHWVRFIEAECVCGEVRNYVFHRVACGDTQSCGCLRKDLVRKRATTHGLSDHLLYDVWQKMVSRCYDENDKGFKNYGARGIEVWLDWKEDFMSFYDWCMENGYKEGLSVERLDNDGNYAPYNCKLATREEQSRNKRSTRNYTAFGETKCLFDWGKDLRCKVGIWTLRSRMDKPHWEGKFEEAMTLLDDSKRARQNTKKTIQITAFGETKCMTEWSRDKRCVVGLDRLRDRMAEGWDGFKAITTVQEDSKEIKLTAFGETKSFTNWLKDERCVVKRDALRDRYRAGWLHEDCLTIPSRTGSKSKL